MAIGTYNVFETHSNGNKSRTWDYYVGTLYGGKTLGENRGACVAYCAKEGFSFGALSTISTTEYDCFCGNNAGTACDTSDCVTVRIILKLARLPLSPFFSKINNFYSS